MRRLDLVPNCQESAALCCVADASFRASEDFAFDKDTEGAACPHLQRDHRCAIHHRLAEEGIPWLCGLRLPRCRPPSHAAVCRGVPHRARTDRRFHGADERARAALAPDRSNQALPALPSRARHRDRARRRGPRRRRARHGAPAAPRRSASNLGADIESSTVARRHSAGRASRLAGSPRRGRRPSRE